MSGSTAISDEEVDEGSPKIASIRGFNAGSIESKRPGKSRLSIGQKPISKSIEDTKDENDLLKATGASVGAARLEDAHTASITKRPKESENDLIL